MKKLLYFAAAILAIALLPACTDTQLAGFQHSLSNFDLAVARVDQSIAGVSASLYKNCTSLQAVGQAAVDIAGQCSKASQVVLGANSVIQGFCQAPPSDIASAVSFTATAISSTKSQLSAAKKSCGS